MALLAFPAAGSAKADVIYSGPQDISILYGGDYYYGQNAYTMNVTNTGPLDGAATNFTFDNNELFGPSYGAELDVSGDAGTSQVVLDSASGSAAALSAGTTVGSSSTFITGVYMGGYSGVDYGDWADAQNLYLGLTFQVAGSTYYGWAELS